MTEFESGYAAGAQSLRTHLRRYYELYVSSGDSYWLDVVAQELANDDAEKRLFESNKERSTTVELTTAVDTP